METGFAGASTSDGSLLDWAFKPCTIRRERPRPPREDRAWANCSSASWLGTGDDQSGEASMELAEEQFAQALASRGGLGLSRLIVQGLKARSEADPSHTEAPPESASKP